jgi:Ca-activated chloride channel family protein
MKRLDRIFVAVTMLLFTISVWAQSRQPQPQLRVTAPAADAKMSGPTVLRAAVEPDGLATAVTFFADGQQICSVMVPPYECYWDAGATDAEHQIRVVATLSGGERIVQTVRTRPPDVIQPALAPTFSMRIDAVPLAVTVSDGNHFVTGLPKSAFHVFEDGVPQSITSFVAEDVPLDLIVAIDISASMAPAMPKLKAAVKEFLAATPPQNSITVLAFNGNVRPVANPSTNPAERVAAIDRLTAYGTTSLYDVVIRSVDLVGRKAGRKAVIVFTDGEDRGSRASIDETERRLQATDASLYMIGQGRGVELDNLKTVMRRLVLPTGGRTFFTDKIDQLRGVFADLLNELSHQYLLAYYPTNTTRDDHWRRIKIDVDGHDQVRTRQGYRLPTGT